MSEKFDLLVIGGGSGGLAAAQRAAEHGARVALVESARLGGTCVNVGCVPKKISWNAADLGSALHEAADYGFRLEISGHDWGELKARRDAYISGLHELYAANLARRGVELVRAHASFADARSVRAGNRSLGAEHIIIATGAHARVPAGPGPAPRSTPDRFFHPPTPPPRAGPRGSWSPACP